MSWCLMFAGQSIQHRGMCRELWSHAPAREGLRRLSATLGDDLEHITTEMGDGELALTWNSQRAIHAHHVCHWMALASYHPGLEVCGAVGHSVGVVAALVAAGALTIEDSGTLVAARARAFAEACSEESEPHGLAAVTTEEHDGLIEVLDEFDCLGLCLQNTRTRHVIGGPLHELQSFVARAEDEAWPVRATLLAVQGAFHSPAFSAAAAAFEVALDRITIRRPNIPVFMGTSGQREGDPARIRRLLVQQLTTCEKHQQAVVAAYEHGCRRFLEVSARPQPVRWLPDQLVDEADRQLPDVVGLPLTTAEMTTAQL